MEPAYPTTFHQIQNLCSFPPIYYPLISSSFFLKVPQMAHICHCLSRLRTLRCHSPLTISSDRRRTGADFADGVLALARGLSNFGIRDGHVVAIAALNSDFYMELFLAVTYVGGIVAPLNYRWSFEEAKSAMEIVRPVMLVVDGSCISWAEGLQSGNFVPSLKLYAIMGGGSSSDGFNGKLSTMDSLRIPAQGPTTPEPVLAPQGIAVICFTSGTTGRPKGVAITHVALIVQSLAKIAIVGYAESDVYLHTAPLCHIGGISSCIAMLLAAGCHVFLPKFDAEASFMAIKQHEVTSLITVPAMLADLVSFSRNAKKSLGGETVSKILNGGGGLSYALLNLAIHIFPRTKIISAYGMTETCSSLTFMTLYDPTLQKSEITHSSNCEVNYEHKGVLVGKPAPHIELRINSDFDCSDSSSVGSILTRGLHVMVGYWGEKLEVKMNYVGQGWLDTGDMGWIDRNGNLWLVGRKKGQIKSGGENVYPEEVEAVLSQHPGVACAVIVGIPDDRLSEKVVACISIREEWKWADQKLSYSHGTNALSSEILHTYCRQQNLTRFKIPKIFMPWTKPLPLTSTGKLKREDVRKEVISCMHFLQSNL